MPRLRRRFDPEFRDGAVRIVKETRRPGAHVARELGVNEGLAWELGASGRCGAGQRRREPPGVDP